MASSPNVACVWGANGISGTAMIDILVEQPRNEWAKIICISRRPTQLDVDDDRIYFISIDILEASVDQIVKELSKAGGEAITHVYHYTYIEKKDENELDEINKRLFQKALDVTVKIAGKHIKCVSLQTGYKVRRNYSNFTVH
jgi:actin-like ATPase involved in cell morphogenesis